MAQAPWQTSNHSLQVAEIAIRSTALMFDFQMQAARQFMEMQARSAAAFGMPDCSSLFSTADERARRLFSESADELVNTTRRASESVAEMNRHIGRLVEKQTVEMAEQMRQGIDQLGRHTEQSLQQARTLVEQGVNEMERAASDVRSATNSTSGSTFGSTSGSPSHSSGEDLGSPIIRPSENRGGEPGRKK